MAKKMKAQETDDMTNETEEIPVDDLQERARIAAENAERQRIAAAKLAEEMQAKAAAAAAERKRKQEEAAALKAAKAAEREAAKAEREAAKAVREAQKAAAREAREAARAAKAAEREAAKASKAAARVNRVKQNGVTQPLPDSICGRAWAIFNAVSAAMKEPAPISACWEMAEAEGINPATLKTQYGLWRKFYGIRTIRVAASPVETAQPEEAVAAE
jgi:hypothetical protein